MSRHVIMDPSGHTTIEFNPATKAELAEAERRFNELLRKGYMPAYPIGEGAHRVPPKGSRWFDPTIAETIFIPALKGG